MKFLNILWPCLALGVFVHSAAAQDQQPGPGYFHATNAVLLALKVSPIEDASSGEYQVWGVSKSAYLGLTDVGTPLTQGPSDKPNDHGVLSVSAKIRAEMLMSAISLAAAGGQPEPLTPVVPASISVLSRVSIVVYQVPAFDEYIVRRGDTLIQIATEQYGDSALTSRILWANFDDIYNPDIIRAGQILILPRQ